VSNLRSLLSLLLSETSYRVICVFCVVFTYLKSFVYGLRRIEVIANVLYLLSTEELQHLIGSETTRQGVMLVFNMFQNPRLNRRLVYVILEGILETIFSENSFPETFCKLHSKSPRVQSNRTASESCTTSSLSEAKSLSSNLRKR